MDKRTSTPLAQVERRIATGMALDAKDLALKTGVSYPTALAWVKEPGFPLMPGGRKFFWLDFEAWRRRRTGVEPPEQSAPQTRGTPSRASAGKSGESRG